MITPNGGVFGRNPKFNTVRTAGSITSGGSVVLGSGANFVPASGNGIDFGATANGGSAAVAARGAITRTATNVADNDTVTIGSIVYTFKTTLTPSDYQVLIGVDSSASLTNLRNAILGTGGSPGDYQVPGPHPTVTASAISGSVLPLVAITAGTAGNSISLAESSAQLSVSAATLVGGFAATASVNELLNDYEQGTWTPVYVPSTGAFAVMEMDIISSSYTKIGRMVIAECFVRTNNVDIAGASGTVQIAGLPFASASSTRSAGSISTTNAWGGRTPFAATIQASSSVVELERKDTVTGQNDGLLVTHLSVGAVANQNRMALTIVYTAT